MYVFKDVAQDLALQDSYRNYYVHSYCYRDASSSHALDSILRNHHVGRLNNVRYFHSTLPRPQAYPRLADAALEARRDGFGVRFGRPFAPAVPCEDLFFLRDVAVCCTFEIAAVLRRCSVFATLS